MMPSSVLLIMASSVESTIAASKPTALSALRRRGRTHTAIDEIEVLVRVAMSQSLLDELPTDTVTDAAGNDTVFTETGLGGSCSYYETQRQVYNGTGSSRALLETVQTSYTWEANPWDSYETTPAHTCLNGFVSGRIDYFHLVLEDGPHDTAIYSQRCPVRR